jgi:hypothetical protein
VQTVVATEMYSGTGDIYFSNSTVWPAGSKMSNVGTVKWDFKAVNLGPGITTTADIINPLNNLWVTAGPPTIPSAGDVIFQPAGAAPPCFCTLQNVIDNNHDMLNGIITIGTLAGDGNTGTPEVIGIGGEAARNNTGDYVIGVGYLAAKGNTGDNVTAVGAGAAGNNTGDYVAAFDNACTGNTGNYVVGIGFQASDGNSGNNVVGIGYEAANNNSGLNVTAVGNQAGKGNTQDGNTFIGNTAGITNTGLGVTAIGNTAGKDNVGDYCTFVGEGAGYEQTGVSTITAIGVSAAFQNSGTEVTALGDAAAYSNTGDRVIAIGASAGTSNVGDDVLVFGHVTPLVTNTLNNVTMIKSDFIPSFANFAAATAVINAGTAAPGFTYLYHDQATNSIGAVRIP